MDKESILIELEKQSLDIQKQSYEKLSVIQKWITFFGVVTIITLIIGIISGITVMANL